MFVCGVCLAYMYMLMCVVCALHTCTCGCVWCVPCIHVHVDVCGVCLAYMYMLMCVVCVVCVLVLCVNHKVSNYHVSVSYHL